MLTTVPYLHRPHSKTSVTGLQWTKAEDVKPESPDILTLPRDLLQSFQSFSLSLVGVAFPAPQRGSESVVIDIEELMEWLARKVRIENPHSIREYLLQFTELLDVIPKAVDAVKKHFPEAQLVMDIYQDPEIADCYLVLYIRLKHYDDSVIERLEKAEAEFLNQLVNKRGWIQLTTDFREPEGEGAL
jgi:hypothetical protein